MVTYDREFLVPYLKNLCALYYAKRKLEEEEDRLGTALRQAKRPTPLKDIPCVPARSYYTDDETKIFLFIGIGCFFAALICFWIGNLVTIFLGLTPLGLSAVYLILGLSRITQANKRYQYACSKYNQDLELVRKENERIKLANERKKETAAIIYPKYETVSTELAHVDSLISRAYNANIIPGNYRDMYCVVYLYDYFSKGRSNDMDIALNTYVLEQIKAKLDIIIQNQSDMLLNQELMLANQERALQDRREHHKRLESKIDRMNCELEEANQYRQVIHSDLETLEFFARDSYIRNLFS